MNDYQIYDKLQSLILPSHLLATYGYPLPDPSDPSLLKNTKLLALRPRLADRYTCFRCHTNYEMGPDGIPSTASGDCIYHAGKLNFDRSFGERRYFCCKGGPYAPKCTRNRYHVHEGEYELHNYKGFVETKAKPKRDPNKHGIFALDCEMCFTAYGRELTKITLINSKFETVYEELVKPKSPILDYFTLYTGLKKGDLDNVTKTLEDVQRDLLKLFSSKSIIIGHGLDWDMKALKIFHKCFIDTTHLYPSRRGLPYKLPLKQLAYEYLGCEIQKFGHDSREDAVAALRLVMRKANL